MTLAEAQNMRHPGTQSPENITLFNQGKLASYTPINPSFMNLNPIQGLFSQNMNMNDQMQDVWKLNKTYGEPDFWDRYLQEFLGGWSNNELLQFETQRKLDEEVFRGIRRSEMLQAGISNQEIDLVRQYVDDQIKEHGANYHLGMSSIPIDFDAVFEDKERAAVIRNYFDNRNQQQNQLGIPLADLLNNQRNGSNGMG